MRIIHVDQHYMDTYGKAPLLSPKEEIVLARTIQEASDPSATPGMKRAAMRARNRMVQANMRLVVTIALKYLPRCNTFDLQDLVQEGTISLYHAIDRFDPARGYKFSTYAYWWIRQGLGRAISNQDRSIRLPIHIIEGLSRVNRFMQAAAADGEKIGLRDAAKAVGLTPDVVEAAVLACGVHSLNYVRADGETELLNTLESERPAADDYTDLFGIDRAELLDIIDRLPEQQRYILTAFFGLDGKRPRSLLQIATALGLTRASVTTARNVAMGKVRRALLLREAYAA